MSITKRLYFQNQIELNKTNIKQTWRILNNTIGQNKKKKLTYPLVDGNGENITSQKKLPINSVNIIQTSVQIWPIK